MLVEGRLIQDTWEDRDTGKKRSKIKMVANTVQFLGSRDGGSGGGRRQAPPPEQRGGGEPLEEDFKGEDDIPF